MISVARSLGDKRKPAADALAAFEAATNFDDRETAAAEYLAAASHAAADLAFFFKRDLGESEIADTIERTRSEIRAQLGSVLPHADRHISQCIRARLSFLAEHVRGEGTV